MKKTVGIIAILFLFANLGFGQASEGEKPMSLGMKNGFAISLKNVKVKKAQDIWEDYIKQYKGKTKYDKKTSEYYTNNAQVYFIGGAADVDIYARFSDTGANGVDVSSFYIVNEEFLTSAKSADMAKGVSEFLRLYSVSVERYVIGEKLKEEQKILDRQQNELKKLLRENENFHKDIENYKTKIAKAESDITVNKGAQENTAKAIEVQGKVVAEVKAMLDALK